MRLAAVGIGTLIMLSGWVPGGLLAGCAAEPSTTALETSTLNPTAALQTPAPSPRSPGQPTTRSTSNPRRTSVTVVMNGDLLWHNTLWYGAREDAQRRGHGGYDFAPLLAGMQPVIASADLAICHQEVPLAKPGGPYRNFPLFAVPPQVVKAIAATGYDVCTTASNHAVDQGFAGLKRTLEKAKGSFRDRLLAAQRRTSAVVMRKHPQGLTRG